MSMLDYPFHIDRSGRVARASAADHVRDMVELVLFTRPGERVGRPDFGCGLGQLAFAPNDPMFATTTQFLVHGALHRWLGDLIDVSAVEIESEQEMLRIAVTYRRKDTGEHRRDWFTPPETLRRGGT
jgi:phage baseplate assembly protein W